MVEFLRKRKKLIILISVIIVLIISLIIVYLVKEQEVKKFSVYIENVEMNSDFNVDTYNYDVFTEDSIVTFGCNNKNIDGCNENIHLEDDKNYIHKIKVADRTYVFNITKINKFKLNITKVLGIPNKWTNEKIKIKIITESTNDVVSYSIDGGNIWQESSEFIIEKNTVLDILVKDDKNNISSEKESIIEYIDVIQPEANLYITQVNDDSIVLNANVTDDLSGISCISFNDSPCTSQYDFVITRAGEYKISVEDNAGNIATSTITIKERDFDKNINSNAIINSTNPNKVIGFHYIDFDVNGAEYIPMNNVSCGYTIDNQTCKVIAPTIVRNDGVIIGWSENKNANEATIKPGDIIELSTDKVYYAITKKTLSISFQKNGADTIGSNRLICDIYNTMPECSIKLPNIFRSKSEVMGWSNDRKSKIAEYSTNSIINIKNNLNLYAITKKTLTATFEKNGVDIIDLNKLTCDIYNEDTKCSINLPVAKRTDGEFIGWSLSNNSHESKLMPKDAVTLSEDRTYYGISKKEVTLKFDKNGADTIGSETLKCTLYNNETCGITLPSISKKDGNVEGWSNNKRDRKSKLKPGDTLAVSDNGKYYALTNSTILTTFKKNGATSISREELKCVAYNDETCQIVLPLIIKDDGDVVGWSKNSNSKTAEFLSNEVIDINEKSTYYAITKKVFTAIFDKNNAESVSNDFVSCEAYNNELCDIITPTFYKKDKISLGWSKDKNYKNSGKDDLIKENSKIKLNNNVTYYAILKKYIATFDKNGADSISSNRLECEVSKSTNNCVILSPNITRVNSTIIGWNSDKLARNSEYNVNSNIILNENKKFYAITSKKIDISYSKNGADNLIGVPSSSCILYNSENCTVQAPTIVKNDGTVVGWGISNDSTTAIYSNSPSLNVSKSSNLYAITYITRTATFDSTGTTSIETTKKSCKAYNGATSCQIILPKYNKTGYYSSYWSIKKLPSINLYGHQWSFDYFYPIGYSYTLTSNMIFYPNFNHFYYDGNGLNVKFREFSIITSTNIGETLMEFETGIPKNVINEFVDFSNEAYIEVPWLFIPTKAFIMTYDTYANNSIAYGLTHNFYYDNTHNYQSYITIDLKYDSKGDVALNKIDDNALLHELAHAWDFYYGYKTNTIRLSEQKDITDFYNKMYSEGKTKIDKVEWFAGMVTNYYWHILEKNNSKQYYALTSKWTDSDKQIWTDIMEKYIKFSNNGYK